MLFILFYFILFYFILFLITDVVCLLSISQLCQSHTAKKLNKPEINYFPQIHQRTEVTGQTPAPRIGKTGQTWRITAQGQTDASREPVPGQEISAIIDPVLWTRAQRESPKLRECSPWRPPCFCEFELQEPYQIITVKMGEKSPGASGKGMRKGTIF